MSDQAEIDRLRDRQLDAATGAMQRLLIRCMVAISRGQLPIRCKILAGSRWAAIRFWNKKCFSSCSLKSGLRLSRKPSLTTSPPTVLPDQCLLAR